MPYSFYGLTKLKWAEIEDSVISISYDAFEYCTALKRVKLSENLTNIDGGVFGYCSALEEISLPESITTIGWAAFESCTSLKSINIPKNLNKCAETTFGGCTNLRALYIEDLSQWLNMEEWPSFSLATFGDIKGIDYYIGGEALENLVIPENITRIRKYAFVHGHNIKTVTFHENVEYIDQEAFSNCVNLELTNDKLPNYLKSIGREAFQNCRKISKVGIPSSVENIGDFAFAHCSGLKQCIFAEDIQIDKISSSMFYGCENLEKIIIPSSVTSIEAGAFQNCKSLEKICIPKNVKSIGGMVFEGCTNIKEVEFEEGSKLTTIKADAFVGCGIKNIQIPAGVISIKDRALANLNLVDITFLGDFGDFSSMFDMGEYHTRTITYYACNNTWTSSEAQDVSIDCQTLPKSTHVQGLHCNHLKRLAPQTERNPLPVITVERLLQMYFRQPDIS